MTTDEPLDLDEVQPEVESLSGSDAVVETKRRIETAIRETRPFLDLSNLNLINIPETVFSMSHLTFLRLRKNSLTELPKSIGRLVNLDTLDLTDNQLVSLPQQLGRLTRLESIELQHNKLKKLPHIVTTLPRLRQLGVSSNKIEKLPASIGRLRRLQFLFASRNLIKSLPDVFHQIAGLRFIDLQDNQLVNLPDSLLSSAGLIGLFLQGNPGLGIPAEVLGPSWKEVQMELAPGGIKTVTDEANAAPADILNYYLRTRRDARPLNEAKLILVGFGEVGKTSLVSRLVHDTFVPSELKTEGIAITDWPIRLNGTEDIRLHVWDFGGQEIMHATHRFFLSQRSVYLLVLNGRGGRQQADAAYWLNLIAIHAPDSPVIIVRNKIREDPCALDRTALRRDFPAVRAVIDTDCADRTGIDDLAAAVCRETDALPELRSRFPAAWFAIKDRLSAMAENYLSFSDYRALCVSNGETDAAAQEALAFFLHCLGIVLNYRDDPRLHDTNVLNPHWVTEGVYGILNHPALTGEQAELRANDLRAMLDGTRFPPERHDFLLQLMRRFELAVPFPEQSDLYLVPERLSPEQPADVGEFDATKCLHFAYDYSTLLPEGLLPRFIVRTHILSTGCPRWRSGVVLRLEGNRALVIGDAINHRVSVMIDGPMTGRRRLLAVIRYDLDHIHRSYQFQPQAIVPVPGHPNVSVPYEKLLRFERDGVPAFPEVVEDRTTMLEVRQLLDGVDLAPPKPAVAMARRETQPITAFISYAHKDETLRLELDTHLKLLQVTRELDAWHDRSITPGEKWEGQINENLQRADVVLLLLSPDFIASDYCRKEMEIALQREAAGETRVVPVIVRPCGWQHLPVQANQALPKDGKPVAGAGHEQGHRDAAWLEVENGIRRVLKALPRRPGP
jgi:internalin A